LDEKLGDYRNGNSKRSDSNTRRKCTTSNQDIQRRQDKRHQFDLYLAAPGGLVNVGCIRYNEAGPYLSHWEYGWHVVMGHPLIQKIIEHAQEDRQ
jgi:hypothetical protein